MKRALFLLSLLALAFVLQAAPRVGDPASSVGAAAGWTKLSDPPGSWSKPMEDGWTLGVGTRKGTIFRVDWWKPCELDEAQAEFTDALKRLGDTVGEVVMLGGWEAILVKDEGDKVIATILSVSSYREAYIVCRSDVLVKRR